MGTKNLLHMELVLRHHSHRETTVQQDHPQSPEHQHKLAVQLRMEVEQEQVLLLAHPLDRLPREVQVQSPLDLLEKEPSVPGMPKLMLLPYLEQALPQQMRQSMLDLKQMKVRAASEVAQDSEPPLEKVLVSHMPAQDQEPCHTQVAPSKAATSTWLPTHSQHPQETPAQVQLEQSVCQVTQSMEYLPSTQDKQVSRDQVERQVPLPQTHQEQQAGQQDQPAQPGGKQDQVELKAQALQVLHLALVQSLVVQEKDQALAQLLLMEDQDQKDPAQQDQAQKDLVQKDLAHGEKEVAQDSQMSKVQVSNSLQVGTAILLSQTSNSPIVNADLLTSLPQTLTSATANLVQEPFHPQAVLLKLMHSCNQLRFHWARQSPRSPTLLMLRIATPSVADVAPTLKSTSSHPSRTTTSTLEESLTS